jgi:hypothetical protein
LNVLDIESDTLFHRATGTKPARWLELVLNFALVRGMPMTERAQATDAIPGWPDTDLF